MNFALLVIGFTLGVLTSNTVLKEFRKIKKSIKKIRARIFGEKRIYVPPHKRTTSVRGYYRSSTKKNKARKKR